MKTWSCIAVLGFCFSVQCLPGFAMAQVSAELNVRDFATIQQAVDALPRSGGVLYFPAGEYEISQPVRVDFGEVTFRGAGPSTILRNVSTSGDSSLEFVGKSPQELRKQGGTGVWRVQLRDLRLTGTEKSGTAISASYVMEMVIQDCWIDHHGGDGIHLYHCTENPRIVDNNIAYNRTAGIFVDGCHDIVISSNEMEENGIGILTVNGFNTTVSGNNIDDHTQNSLVFRNMRGSIVSSNMIENCKGSQIVLDERSDGTTISANMIRQNRAEPPVWIKSAFGITITGNTFEGSPDWAIRVEPGNSNIVVTGNTFGQIQLVDRPPTRPMDQIHGILLTGACAVTISGNSLFETQGESIAVRGTGNRQININGNTILRPSKSDAGEHAGILLEGIEDSIVAQNIVIDDRPTPEMTYAIYEGGESRFNIFIGNRVSKGRSGSLRAEGEGDLVQQNLMR